MLSSSEMGQGRLWPAGGWYTPGLPPSSGNIRAFRHLRLVPGRDMRSNLYVTFVRVAWTADSRSNVDCERSSAPGLGKHVVKSRRMPERSEGDRLTRRLVAIGKAQAPVADVVPES